MHVWPHKGLDYIWHSGFTGRSCAVLGSLGSASDERVDAVVRDAKPNVVLTTSAIMGDVVARYATAGIASPPTVAVDQLDLDSPIRSLCVDDSPNNRIFAVYVGIDAPGVMITYKNILANFQQMISAYFADTGAVPAIGLSLCHVPFLSRHGFGSGSLCADYRRDAALCSQAPVAFLQQPARWPN